MVEIDVILVDTGQTIPSHHEKYIGRNVDGKKEVIFQLRLGFAHLIVF